jgi:DNA-binding Lrp family transcriptional regulator
VLACYTMTGEMDFLLHVIVRDIEALSDFTTRGCCACRAYAPSRRPSCSRP